MKYVVKATCFWENRYYKKGETVDFDSSVTPPVHFALIDKPAEKPKQQDEPKTSKTTKARAKAKQHG